MPKKKEEIVSEETLEETDTESTEEVETETSEEIPEEPGTEEVKSAKKSKKDSEGESVLKYKGEKIVGEVADVEPTPGSTTVFKRFTTESKVTYTLSAQEFDKDVTVSLE